MKTCFIIVNYNDYQTTKTLIDNIKNYKIIDDIIIVDNNSSDDSVDNLNKLEVNNLKIIKAKQNKGYNAGINLGIKFAIEKHITCNIIISNADIIINSEKDIKELLNILNKPNVGVAAPTVIEGTKKNRGWKIPSPMIDVLMNFPYFHRYFKIKFLDYKENYYKKTFSQVEAVSGCFFLMKSSTIERMGYFNENVFLFYEENILGSKIKQLNLRILVSNKIEVSHRHSVSINKSVKKINKYKVLKKSQAYFQKNYNHANLLERGLLFTSNKMTLGILHVIYFIETIFSKK